MERKPQNYANHAKFTPLYHFFLVPLGLVLLIWNAVNFVRNPSPSSGLLLLMMLAIAVVIYLVRIFPLGVQDRIIRLEERLRLMAVLQEPLRSRIGELEDRQLIGLRFASESELPELVKRALDEKLGLDDIKKAVKDWRPDYKRI